VRIKPGLAETVMTSEGDFTTVFINGAGVDLIVNGSELRMFNGVECKSYSVDDVAIAPHDEFEIRASGCGKGVPGDVYKLQITIPYTLTMGDATATYTEKGYIIGVFE